MSEQFGSGNPGGWREESRRVEGGKGRDCYKQPWGGGPLRGEETPGTRGLTSQSLHWGTTPRVPGTLEFSARWFWVGQPPEGRAPWPVAAATVAELRSHICRGARPPLRFSLGHQNQATNPAASTFACSLAPPHLLLRGNQSLCCEGLCGEAQEAQSRGRPAVPQREERGPSLHSSRETECCQQPLE